MLINNQDVTSVDHRFYNEDEVYITLWFNTSTGKQCFDIYGNDLHFFKKYFTEMLVRGIPKSIKVEFEYTDMVLFNASEKDIQSIVEVFKKV